MPKTKTEFTVGFTGISGKLTAQQQENVSDEIARLGGSPAKFYSGAATGVDVLAADTAMGCFPDAKHFVCIPYWRPKDGLFTPCEYDVTGVQELIAAGALAVHLSALKWCGDDPADGYMRRNLYLATRCTHMLAFPRSKKEERRSGTWSTIRRAKKLKRKVKIVPLGG